MQYVSIIIFSLTLLGCKSTYTSGQYIEQKQIEQIKILSTTKDTLIDMIGTPTIIFDEDTWYYIARTNTERAFFKPKTINQQVIKLTFNSNVVNSINLLDNDTYDISINPNITKVKGTEYSIFKHFIYNLGRFRSDKQNK